MTMYGAVTLQLQTRDLRSQFSSIPMTAGEYLQSFMIFDWTFTSYCLEKVLEIIAVCEPILLRYTGNIMFPFLKLYTALKHFIDEAIFCKSYTQRMSNPYPIAGLKPKWFKCNTKKDVIGCVTWKVQAYKIH